MKTTVDILCGVPGSGKSTWARQQKDKLIINKDSFRSMLYGKYDFYPQDEKLINCLMYHTVKELLRNKRNFIIDECNITKGNRIDILRFIRNNSVGDYQVNAVYFKVAPDIDTLGNRMKDARGYDAIKWKEIIDRMAHTFEVPTIDEGFNNIVTVDVKNWY